MTKPEEYYAAGILLYIKNDDDSFFKLDYLQEWGSLESLGFGDAYHEPFLKDNQLTRKALKLLSKEGIIKVYEDPYGPDMVRVLKPRFLDEFEGDEPSDVFSKTLNFGYPWITSALKKINSNLQNGFEDLEFKSELSNDISDSEWYPLPIEREDPLFQEGLKAVEEALKIIEYDNGYAANEPEERNAILASAKGTVEALKDGNPSKESVSATLITPFKYLAKKFGDGIIGAAAKTIWEFGIKILTSGAS